MSIVEPVVTRGQDGEITVTWPAGTDVPEGTQQCLMSRTLLDQVVMELNASRDQTRSLTDLLRRYIDHVGQIEGTDFLDDRDGYGPFRSDIVWTDHEWGILQTLRKAGQE